MNKKLCASENHILTNDKIYGVIIYPSQDLDISTFYEITLEEYNRRIEANEESLMQIPEDAQ